MSDIETGMMITKIKDNIENIENTNHIRRRKINIRVEVEVEVREIDRGVDRRRKRGETGLVRNNRENTSTESQGTKVLLLLQERHQRELKGNPTWKAIQVEWYLQVPLVTERHDAINNFDELDIDIDKTLDLAYVNYKS